VTISCEVDVTSATVELTTDDGSLAVDKGCEVEGCEVDDLCIVPRVYILTVDGSLGDVCVLAVLVTDDGSLGDVCILAVLLTVDGSLGDVCILAVLLTDDGSLGDVCILAVLVTVDGSLGDVCILAVRLTVDGSLGDVCILVVLVFGFILTLAAAKEVPGDSDAVDSGVVDLG